MLNGRGLNEGKKLHKILYIDLVAKKVWQRIMRVRHFSHVLKPPKNQNNVMWYRYAQKIFFFLQHHFYVFFSRIALIYSSVQKIFLVLIFLFFP